MLDHDRSRYISNHFWASMSREVYVFNSFDVRPALRRTADSLTGHFRLMRCVTSWTGSSSEQENDDQDQSSEAKLSSRVSHNSRDFPIFSPSVGSFDHFDVFQENVDPVVHILHRPTMRKTITEVLPLLDGSSLDRMTEVVVFSICCAASTSLSDADCQRLLGEERRVLLSRYRYAIEQSKDPRGLDIVLALPSSTRRLPPRV
ncbi:hypothetical protein ACQKWADRAFT_244428 [Trichoderma austrokoningii]